MEYKTKVIKIQTGLGTVYVQLMYDISSGKLMEIMPTVGHSGNSIQVKAQVIGLLCTLSLSHGATVKELIEAMAGLSDEKPYYGIRGMVKSIPDAISIVLADELDAGKE